MKNRFNSLALLLALCLLLASKISVAQAPSLLGITPSSGPVGTTVVITGSGFNSTTTNNIVYFGATRATVSASTANSVTVTVPAGATYKPISLLNTATHLTGYSTNPFTVTFAPYKTAMVAADIAATVDFSNNGPTGIKIADLDADGKPDLVMANQFANNVGVYRNLSTSGAAFTAGSLGTRLDLATNNAPASVAVGDLDADGKPDLVVTNYNSANISVYKNTSTVGSISFAAKVDFAAANNPTSALIADLDGNGQPEIIVANQGSNSISVYRNISDPGILDNTAFSAKVDYAANSFPQTVTAADFDGDGKPDLAFANSGSNTASVLQNTSTSGAAFNAGSFAARVDYITASSPVAIAGADFDGDGKNEMIVTNGGANSVSIFRNTSTLGVIDAGTFAAKVDFTTAAGPRAINVADLNGDGKPEIFTANLSAPGASAISLFLNTSTSGTINAGSASAKIDIPLTLGSPGSVITGDVDGDGRPDIIAGNDNNLSLLRNLIPPPNPPAITSFTPASGLINASVTINGTNFGATPAANTVFFGAVKATVTSANATQLIVTVPVQGNYDYISVTNTTTNLTAYSAKPFVTTFTPVVNRGFIPRVDLTAGNFTRHIAMGDLDGDGKPDLVAASNIGTAVSVYRNTSVSGTLSYAAKVDLTVDNGPMSAAIGDIDGDGKPDLVTTSGTTLSVFRNTSVSGSISFAAKVDFTTLTSAASAIIGDLDGDGNPDVAVTNGTLDNMSVFRNTSTVGNISFGTRLDIATGLVPTSISMGDLDGDGKPDLVVANEANSSVSVFRNISPLGGLSFEARVNFTTATTPWQAAIEILTGMVSQTWWWPTSPEVHLFSGIRQQQALLILRRLLLKLISLPELCRIT